MTSTPLFRHAGSPLGQRATANSDSPWVGSAASSPAIDTWSGPLLAACAEVIGCSVAYAEGPVELDMAYGTWAFLFRLTGTVPDGESGLGAGGWDGPLVVRLVSDPAQIDREAAAMSLSREHRCGGTKVRHIAALDVGDASDPLWALVSEAATGVGLPELIGFNLHHGDALLRGFAANHVAIHRIPVEQVEGSHALPRIVAADEVARIDSGRFLAERRWLDEHLPSTGDPVLCHGGYQPLCVFGPRPNDWETHGGPGKGLTVVNWGGATLGDPEFDVALTLVAFWSAPFFAKNRSERTAIKMIRNTLLNTYTLGYDGYHQLDQDRLRFWRAFHTLRGLARLQNAYAWQGSPFEAQDRGPLPDELGPELERHFRQITRLR